MNKIIALVIATISVNAFAQNNTNLQIDKSKTPPVMSGQIDDQLNLPEEKEIIQHYRKPNRFSIAAGYSGSNLSTSEGYGEKGKGFFLNGAYNFDDSVNFWVEYDSQKTSDIHDEYSDYNNSVNFNSSYDFDEIAFGVQYKLNNDLLYVGIATGFGFARLKYNENVYGFIQNNTYNDSISETYDYYSWRIIDLELGAEFTNNFSGFINVGYKILFSLENDTVCNYSYCETGRAEDLDLDGATYKVGLRYSF